MRVGLLDALSRVPDPRDPRGVRYAFTSILAVAVCAALAGARSYSAIAEWASDAPPQVRAALGLPGPAPDLVTIWRVLTAVDPAALDAAIGSWVTAQLARARPGPARAALAVDGKTLRGARTGDGCAPHLMACLDHASGTVLAQVAVDGKTNEIPMFAVVLDQIADLAGTLVTADALHAQREHATYLHRRSAHYLLTVKGNQPSLRDQLRTLPWADVPAGHTKAGRAHGRIEKRTVKVVTVTAGLHFPHARQAMQITRKTRLPAAGNGAPRPPMPSPRCQQSTPGQPSSPPGSAATGRSRTSCTGSATSPTAKTSPRPAPAPDPTSWPACATSPSASCAWPARPASPAPFATPRETTPGRFGSS